MKQALGFGLFIVVFTMIFNKPTIELPSVSKADVSDESPVNNEPDYRSHKPKRAPVIERKTNDIRKEEQIVCPKLSKTYYESAVHESAHYVIYEKACEWQGIKTHSIEVSIIPQKNNGGHFSFDGYIDFATETLVNYSGYASRVVFFNESAKSVFSEMKNEKYSDFVENQKIRGDRTISEYDDFIAAVQWVEKYKVEIAHFAIRLQKEKLIKF